jgi:DNA-binding NarL/FixJ family response regulator
VHDVTPRTVLADPDVMVRNLLRVVCDRHDIRVVGETGSGAELLDLCEAEAPDVVVAAGALSDGLIESFLAAVLRCGVRVVVLCNDPSPERLTGLLAGGVSGYLMHDSAPDAVAESVVAVARGAAALHPAAAVTILEQWRQFRRTGGGSSGGLAPRVTLTPRERDVLVAMVDGLATKAIARRLGVAIKTVENHKIRVFDKLGVRTQAHAVSIAIGQGLLAGDLVGS